MKMRTWMMVVVSGVMVAQVEAGYQISVKSTTEGQPVRGRRGAAQQGQVDTNVVQMAVDGEKARVDFKEGRGPGTGEGGYLVTTNAGKTFYMVSPKDKTYMKWDMEAMMGLADAVGGMMQMKVSDPKVETILDEAGETIQGYPTRHHKSRISYQMSMTVMGFKNEQSIVKEDETWTTKALDIATLGSWFNQRPKMKNAELEKLMEAERDKMQGIPLKMCSVQTSTDQQGKSTVTRSGMEVTEIKKIGADEVAAEIPADYKEMNLFQGANSESDESTPQERPARKRSSPKIDFGSMFKKALESQE